MKRGKPSSVGEIGLALLSLLLWTWRHIGRVTTVTRQTRSADAQITRIRQIRNAFNREKMRQQQIMTLSVVINEVQSSASAMNDENEVHRTLLSMKLSSEKRWIGISCPNQQQSLNSQLKLRHISPHNQNLTRHEAVLHLMQMSLRRGHIETREKMALQVANWKRCLLCTENCAVGRHMDS